MGVRKSIKSIRAFGKRHIPVKDALATDSISSDTFKEKFEKFKQKQKTKIQFR